MVHTCRGTISLHGAVIQTEDSCTFNVSNGGAQTFHIRAANEVERNTWVTALELAKVNAMQQESGNYTGKLTVINVDRLLSLEITEDTEEPSGENGKVEVTTTIKILSQKMEDLQLCSDLITKHGNSLQKSLSELESMDSANDMVSLIKAINEKATVYRIASSRMINVSSFIENDLRLRDINMKKFAGLSRVPRTGSNAGKKVAENSAT